MSQPRLSEDLKPLTELKTHSADIVKQVSDTGRPVVLTRHGRGVAVLLSLDAYEEMEERIERAGLRVAIAQGEQAISEGRVVPGSAVEAQLQAWAAGEP